MSDREFKVLLVYPNPRKMSLVPTSIALFSSLLKNENITVDLFDSSLYEHQGFQDNDEIVEQYLFFKPAIEKFKEKIELNTTDAVEAFRLKVEEFKPDMIAVSCVECTFEYALSLLRSVSEKKILTVLGGVFATFSPEYALSFYEIDIVCVGEGERAIVELANALRAEEDHTKINNLYVKKDGQIIKNKIGKLVSLDELPVGDFEIFSEDRFVRAMSGEIYKMAPVETHRGCTNVCTFCNSPLQNKLYCDETGEKYFRAKSIKKVYKQIKYFVDKFQVEYLFFWADNFFAYPLKQIEEFCEMYSEFKLPFYCQSYPGTITEIKLGMLKSVGLKRLGVGIEHGNEEFRRKIIKRAYSNKYAIKKLSLVHKFGIELSTNNIIGFPDETPELVMDTVELNKAVEPDTASCAIFTPFRGTYLRELTIERGYLKDENILAPSNAEFSVLDMPQFTRDQIENKRRTFNLYIKFPRDRWDEIEMAEKLTPEGDRVWKELSKEFHEIA